MTPKRALELAVTAAGGEAALARVVGVTRQAVHQWRLKGIPAGRVKVVEQATDGRISREQLRPDVFA